MQPTTPMDDFWLYDFPINPICVPSIITFERPKNGTIDQQFDTILNRVEAGHRTRCYLVKYFGKYFLKDQSLKDFKKRCEILHDVKSDKDVLEFF